MNTNLDMPERIYVPVPRPCRNAGKKWTEDEVAYLAKAVMRGDDLFRICDLMSRPYQGMLSKLNAMRLITWEGHHRGHVWNERRVRRRDAIPRRRDTHLSIRPSDAQRLYDICRDLAATEG